MGENHAPFKGSRRPKSLACQSGMAARVWATRCEPRNHVVDGRGALATASSRHSGPSMAPKNLDGVSLAAWQRVIVHVTHPPQ